MAEHAAPMSVTLSQDRTQVFMQLGNWSGSISVSDLPRWISFYRELRDRRAGRYRAFYAADVAALEALEAELKRGAE